MTSENKKWVYYFGENTDKSTVGGKGVGLSDMVKLGLPIPPGFSISTQACIAFQQDQQWPAGLNDQVQANLQRLETEVSQKLGDSKSPLLVSVRSGAAVSMPGMMDTVLNLGLNERVVQILSQKFNNERFAYDSYRRFITMFADVVMGVPREKFEHVIDELKKAKKVQHDTDLDARDMKELTRRFLIIYKQHTKADFPQDPQEQLRLSINAVFKSWNNNRAIRYRELNHLPHNMGTAVNVQAMVFGNMGDDCATGVAFTRDPSTGENKRYGEYLLNAQGEDVVAGIRTPKNLDHMKQDMPEIHKQLYHYFDLLEKHYKDVQDIEFTIQNRKLYLLQTRNAKRTAYAAVKVAVDLVAEGLITKQQAILRVEPKHLETLLHKHFDNKAKAKFTAIAKGLPASPGAAVGQIVFTAEQAVLWKSAGKQVVLVRLETSPEDISGMAVAQGILTARGGMTSHAAVVARGMNVCCVAGCGDIAVHEKQKNFVCKGKTYREGDWISLDGSTGEVYSGKLPVITPDIKGDFNTILSWADEFRKIGVLANADTPADAKVARDFGAQGIGLVRTEHMFFDAKRINVMREMILANDTAGRKLALNKLLPFQRDDFKGILSVMSGLPVVIRLIDPPLHEFLPHEDKDIAVVAKEMNISAADIKRKVVAMHEFNPMLGFRGCRLGIVYPEINEMQVRAIFEASVALVKEGKAPRPLIEIPLVGTLKEFIPLKKMVRQIAKETGAEGKVKYEVGTMIEVPRAALVADELAKEADFFSFGTNDLTQMTCGFSRDDSSKFLEPYVKQGIYSRDPFEAIDQEGVGKLMRICVALARGTNPHIDIGICGEHGGEPSSVMFCHRIGMDNVSCSPYRVPIARLAAAHAALKFGDPQRIPIKLELPSKL